MPGSGALGFGVFEREFVGYDVLRAHHDDVLRKARDIGAEFDRADEYISDAAARRLAYEEGGGRPSAYAFIFASNFLTSAELTKDFDRELRRLCRSLTPGGLLIVLGSTAAKYQTIYEQVREMAAGARLLDASPASTFSPNDDPVGRATVATHIRRNLEVLGAHATDAEVTAVESALPGDLMDASQPVKFPDFAALVFVRRPVRQESRGSNGAIS